MNKNIKPEEGLNLDFGFRTITLNNRVKAEITAYNISVKNLIITTRDDRDNFYAYNAGKTVHRGIESILSIYLLKYNFNNPHNLQFTISHTLMNNFFKQFYQGDLDLSGRKLPGLPTSLINSRLNYEKGRFTLVINFNHINTQYLNDNNSLKYSGHELMYLSSAYFFKINNSNVLTIKTGLINIFDTNHASMVLVNAPSQGGAEPRYYYPGQPRNFYLGLSYKF